MATCPWYHPAFCPAAVAGTRSGTASDPECRTGSDRKWMDGWIILEQTKDPEQHGYVRGRVSRRTVIVLVLLY